MGIMLQKQVIYCDFSIFRITTLEPCHRRHEIWTYYLSFWSTWSGDSKYIICFAKYLNFAKIKAIMYFAKFVNAFVKPRNLNFRETNYVFGISRSPASKWYIICSCSESLKFFRTSKNGLKSDHFAKIAHKIAKPKYFPNIFDDSDSPINSLSDDI